MAEEGYNIPDAHCDSCDRQGLKLYHRYRDGNRWLCKRCVNQKKFTDKSSYKR
jgi:recombinational DNA repair protein (RecF pathway)